MGFFDIVKTVSTGGLNKVVTNKTVQKTTNKLVNPVTQLKAVAKVASKNTVLKKVNAAVNPLTQVKAAAKVQQAAAKRTTAVFTAMRLPVAASGLNVKKLVTNPKGYVSDIGGGLKKDVGFAKDFFGNVKKGNFAGILNQGVADTKNALQAAKTGVVKTIPNTLAAVTPPITTPDIGEQPADGSLAGAILQADSAQTSGASTMPIMLLAAGAAAILLLVVLRH